MGASYLDMYRNRYGKDPKGICPYQVGYEQYAVPIETNGCIHKAIDCTTCWDRRFIPYCIGDVVYAADTGVSRDGIIIENGNYSSVLVAFDEEHPYLHNGITSSINVPGGYKESIFRVFDLVNIYRRNDLRIEDIMPREKLLNLLRLGYK